MANRVNSDEFKLLTSLCALKFHSSHEIVLPTKVDWESVIDLAEQHRLTQLLAKGLTDLEIPIDDELKSKWSTSNKKIHRKMLHFAREAFILSDALKKKQIEFLFLKGPFTSYKIFGDLSSKHSRDIDLFIDESQLTECISVLESLGYCLHSSYKQFYQKQKKTFRKNNNQIVFFHKKKKIQLEIHWRLFANKYYFASSFKEQIENKQTIDITSESVDLFSDEYLLIYLCAHSAKHKWALLYWLFEIAAYTYKNDFEWNRVLEMSQNLNVERPLVQGIFLCNHFFNLPIPDVLKAYAEGDSQFKGLVKSAINEIYSLHGESERSRFMENLNKLIYKLRLSKSLRYKAASFRWISTKDFELIKIPESLFFLYFCFRPLFWLWRYTIPSFIRNET